MKIYRNIKSHKGSLMGREVMVGKSLHSKEPRLEQRECLHLSTSESSEVNYMKKICSEVDCFKSLDSELETAKMPDGSFYPPSLKCWYCRTPQDKKKIKAYRKRHREINP